jgi:hypothetical protein
VGSSAGLAELEMRKIIFLLTSEFEPRTIEFVRPVPMLNALAQLLCIIYAEFISFI